MDSVGVWAGTVGAAWRSMGVEKNMMSRSGAPSNLPLSTGIPRGQIAVFFLILLVFVVGGAWFYFAQRDHLQREVEKDLKAISQLKTDQIVAWRSGQLIQGKIYADALLLAPETARWLENPGSESAEPILKLFQSLQQPLRYDDIQLVNTGGRIVLSLRGQTGPIHAGVVTALAEAFRTRQGVLSDLHPGPGDLSGHIEAVMPLLAENGQPLGALLLLYSTREYLYPLIQSWPTASQTAETLLVRRDGDSVLFLNELRHQKDTAMKLRIPLSQTDVPSVQAVLGKEGIVEGTDYRGIRVVSVLKPIPDSPWFMVAKMDWNEAFAAWRYRSILILSLMGTFNRGPVGRDGGRLATAGPVVLQSPVSGGGGPAGKRGEIPHHAVEYRRCGHHDGPGRPCGISEPGGGGPDGLAAVGGPWKTPGRNISYHQRTIASAGRKPGGKGPPGRRYRRHGQSHGTDRAGWDRTADRRLRGADPR